LFLKLCGPACIAGALCFLCALCVISTSLLYAQENFSDKIYDVDSVTTNEKMSHHSISLGGGLLLGKGALTDAKSFVAISTSVHFSKLWHCEIQYWYRKDRETKDEVHVLFLIPQLGFNLYDGRVKFYGGIGIAVMEVLVEKAFLPSPTGNVKIEYRFNRWVSANTETVFFPLALKLNLNFYLPY